MIIDISNKKKFVFLGYIKKGEIFIMAIIIIIIMIKDIIIIITIMTKYSLLNPYMKTIIHSIISLHLEDLIIKAITMIMMIMTIII